MIIGGGAYSEQSTKRTQSAKSTESTQCPQNAHNIELKSIAIGDVKKVKFVFFQILFSGPFHVLDELMA